MCVQTQPVLRSFGLERVERVPGSGGDKTLDSLALFRAKPRRVLSQHSLDDEGALLGVKNGKDKAALGVCALETLALGV